MNYRKKLNKYTTIKEVKKYKLFEVIGIELEFTIVDIDTFEIKNIARRILKENDFSNEYIDISNEMVNHVIELKLKNPIMDFDIIEKEFYKTILKINNVLKEYNSILIPFSLHPTMYPKDSEIWKGKDRSIYKVYDKLFGFDTHSFSNMQSLQITFPYETEEEMVELHNSIRLILPLIKTLTSSSPFIEKERNNLLSNRIYFFEYSQSKLLNELSSPITDYINKEDDYLKYLDKLYEICESFEVKNIKPQWFNSQGSMIKFNLSAIELRLCDIQESILTNTVISEYLYKVIKYIYTNIKDKKIETKELLDMFHTDSVSKKYLKLFNLKDKEILNQKEMLSYLLKKIKMSDKSKKIIQMIIDKNLSERILIDNETFNYDYIKKIKNCFLENKIYTIE